MTSSKPNGTAPADSKARNESVPGYHRPSIPLTPRLLLLLLRDPT
jgi:hypothetical protein